LSKTVQKIKIKLNQAVQIVKTHDVKRVDDRSTCDIRKFLKLSYGSLSTATTILLYRERSILCSKTLNIM